MYNSCDARGSKCNSCDDRSSKCNSCDLGVVNVTLVMPGVLNVNFAMPGMAWSKPIREGVRLLISESINRAQHPENHGPAHTVHSDFVSRYSGEITPKVFVFPFIMGEKMNL